jgi:acyl-coenzyme A thioesterase PaaI-like protein
MSDTSAEPPPVLTPEGSSTLSPMVAPSGRSWVLGQPGDGRLRIAYFRRDADGALVGKVWFGPWTEGPPGHAHGGAMAAALDDAIGKVGWLNGHRVVAAKLEVQFRRLLPIGTDANIEAVVARVEGRKVFTRGRLFDESGEPFAEAEGLFVEIAGATIDRLRNR